MTRNDARALFASSGLTYEALSEANLRKLIGHIDAAMKASGLMGGTYRMRRACAVKAQAGKPWAALRCKSDYFKDREAVTFNPDGFVGFAGWADNKNIMPVLDGFSRWVHELAPTQALVA